MKKKAKVVKPLKKAVKKMAKDIKKEEQVAVKKMASGYVCPKCGYSIETETNPNKLMYCPKDSNAMNQVG